MRAVYKKEMKKSGWKMEKAPKTEKQAPLIFVKQQQTASVTIFPEEKGIEVWLRVSLSNQ